MKNTDCVVICRVKVPGFRYSFFYKNVRMCIQFRSICISGTLNVRNYLKYQFSKENSKICITCIMPIEQFYNKGHPIQFDVILYFYNYEICCKPFQVIKKSTIISVLDFLKSEAENLKSWYFCKIF